jgi:Sap, sulfolipid-1-addressing protein
MGGELLSIFLLALASMFNPTLLAAVTIMMLLPNTKRLMFGYLLGAYLTSITAGMLIVFSLNDSSSVSTAKQTLSPVEDLVLGALALIVAYVLGGGRTESLRERRRRRKEEKEKDAGEKVSWPERMLGRGSARVTFAVGVVLTFPGVSYLTALDRIAGLDTSTAVMAVIVVLFCLFQQLLLELPLLGYALAPERTQRAVIGFREWLARNGRTAATAVAAGIGLLLIVRGVIELLAG